MLGQYYSRNLIYERKAKHKNVPELSLFYVRYNAIPYVCIKQKHFITNTIYFRLLHL